MDLQARYEEVLRALAQGGRGLQKFTAAEAEELVHGLGTHPDQAVPLLCLLAHSAYPLRSAEGALLKFLSEGQDPAQLVMALNAARKHVIQGRFKDGDRLTPEFLDCLSKLLRHSDPEVVEWTLRTVEECGAQSILLKPAVLKLRPSIFSLWRASSRTILELVTLLERRWTPPDASQKR